MGKTETFYETVKISTLIFGDNVWVLGKIIGEGGCQMPGDIIWEYGRA